MVKKVLNQSKTIAGKYLQDSLVALQIIRLAKTSLIIERKVLTVLPRFF